MAEHGSGLRAALAAAVVGLVVSLIVAGAALRVAYDARGDADRLRGQVAVRLATQARTADHAAVAADDAATALTVVDSIIENQKEFVHLMKSFQKRLTELEG